MKVNMAKNKIVVFRKGGYLARNEFCTLDMVQELCESQGGRPELSVLTSLLVSVDVKNY